MDQRESMNGSSGKASEQQQQAQPRPRPLLGGLARSNPAQSARRTFAQGGGLGGTSPSRRSHQQQNHARAATPTSAHGHQSRLRQATATAVPASVEVAGPALASMHLDNEGSQVGSTASTPPPPRSRHSNSTLLQSLATSGTVSPAPSSMQGPPARSSYRGLIRRLETESHGLATSAQRSDEGDPEPSSPPSQSRSNRRWTVVETSTGAAGGVPPCPRSLHAAAVINNSFVVFGGYDGQQRLNDFHSFSFSDRRWSPILPSASSGSPPSPRDRHVALAYNSMLYVFGGFDGTSRVADFFGFDFSSMTWRQVLPASGGGAPSPRHSHSAVVYKDSAFVYGGYDGSYRSDFHEFNFITRTWNPVESSGRAPRARYRATTVVHCNTMILFGGHDGTRHLADTHVFDFDAKTWTTVLTEGSPPIPRDSHVSVVHRDSMFVFGGSTGSAMNDLLELSLPTTVSPSAKWRTVDTPPHATAGHRFCHVACTYEDSCYVFGGYDGSNRLNDFIRYDYEVDYLTCEVPLSTLVSDMGSYLNDDTLSDIVFVVEDQPVHAHKILLTRCPYFQAMLLGPMMESGQSEIRIEQISYPIFLMLLEYIYTDTVRIPLDSSMDLFSAANQFGLPRLQAMCEKRILETININSAPSIFLAADMHSADGLRTKTLKYILAHFEMVSKTDAFEEMARENVELVFEILKCR